MEEINSVDKEKKALRIKLYVASRCARAALLLSSLKNSPISSPVSPQFDRLKNDEVEVELKRELMKARKKNNKMRLRSRLGLCVRLAILFCLWTLSLLVTFVFLSLVVEFW